MRPATWARCSGPICPIILLATDEARGRRCSDGRLPGRASVVSGGRSRPRVLRAGQPRGWRRVSPVLAPPAGDGRILRRAPPPGTLMPRLRREPSRLHLVFARLLKGAAICMSLLALGLLSAFVAMQVVMEKDRAEVADVVGLDSVAARALIREAGLRPRVVAEEF